MRMMTAQARRACEAEVQALRGSVCTHHLAGLLYLRLGENYRAFDFLGTSLTHDAKNSKTILAAGSIIQDHSDMDVALIKYRIAAVQTPNSAQVGITLAPPGDTTTNRLVRGDLR